MQCAWNVEARGWTDETVQRMLSEDELRDALLLVFANKQVRPSLSRAWSCAEHDRICPTP